MDGAGRDDRNVVPLSLARLERVIEMRLADSMASGREPTLSVTVLDADTPSVTEDPALYDGVVDRIVEAIDGYLANAEYSTPLTADALNTEIEAVFRADSDPGLPSLDRFVAWLRCMGCGIVTRDATSGCATYLHRNAGQGRLLRVGDRFDLGPSSDSLEYYVIARQPADDEGVHLLEGWECPHCESLNWAEVVLRDSLVSSVWSVALSSEVLERAHYVTSECLDLAAKLSGRSAWTIGRDELFGLLFADPGD